MRILILLLTLFLSTGSFAQPETLETPAVETVSMSAIEVKPEFPGGYQEFYAFIGRNYKTPNVKGLAGRVFVSFVVDVDGSLVDIKVIRDLGYGTGEEAVRVLKLCPLWIPGEQSGKKVRAQYSLPISIKTK